MQGGISRIRTPAGNLNHFTAATGPAIFRGDALPSDLGEQFLSQTCLANTRLPREHQEMGSPA